MVQPGGVMDSKQKLRKNTTDETRRHWLRLDLTLTPLMWLVILLILVAAVTSTVLLVVGIGESEESQLQHWIHGDKHPFPTTTRPTDSRDADAGDEVSKPIVSGGPLFMAIVSAAGSKNHDTKGPSSDVSVSKSSKKTHFSKSFKSRFFKPKISKSENIDVSKEYPPKYYDSKDPLTGESKSILVSKIDDSNKHYKVPSSKVPISKVPVYKTSVSKIPFSKPIRPSMVDLERSPISKSHVSKTHNSKLPEKPVVKVYDSKVSAISDVPLSKNEANSVKSSLLLQKYEAEEEKKYQDEVSTADKHHYDYDDGFLDFAESVEDKVSSKWSNIEGEYPVPDPLDVMSEMADPWDLTTFQKTSDAGNNLDIMDKNIDVTRIVEQPEIGDILAKHYPLNEMLNECTNIVKSIQMETPYSHSEMVGLFSQFDQNVGKTLPANLEPVVHILKECVNSNIPSLKELEGLLKSIDFKDINPDYDY